MAIFKKVYTIGNIKVTLTRSDTGYKAATHYKGAQQMAYCELPSEAIIAVINLCN